MPASAFRKSLCEGPQLTKAAANELGKKPSVTARKEAEQKNLTGDGASLTPLPQQPPPSQRLLFGHLVSQAKEPRSYPGCDTAEELNPTTSSFVAEGENTVASSRSLPAPVHSNPTVS